MGVEDNTYWCFFDTSDVLVRWNVARGMLNPVHKSEDQLISFFMRSRLIRAKKNVALWNLETDLETVRQSSYNHKVSRLTGFFAFPNKQMAEYAAENISVKYWGNVPPTEIGADSECLVSQHDQNWITFLNTKTGKNYPLDWMDKYWKGEICSYANIDPIWEVLIDGQCWILDKALRQECYNRLEKELDCHFLLRLSPFAALYKFDTGLTSLCLVKKETCLTISPVLKFNETEALSTIEKMKNEYPEQAKLIKTYSDTVLCKMPNFRDQIYCLQHGFSCDNT